MDFLKKPTLFVLDTKFFLKEFKENLLAEFDDFDGEINGLFLNSENFQGLNLLSLKFRNKISSNYIDPPFNLGESKDFLYKVNYKDSSWLSLLRDRIQLHKMLLKDNGSSFHRCDVNGNYISRALLDDLFNGCFNNELVIKKANQQGAVLSRFNPSTESLFFHTKSIDNFFNPLFKKRDKEVKWINMHSPKENTHSHTTIINGIEFIAPKNRHWTFSQKRVEELILKDRLRIDEKIEYIDVYGQKQKGMPQYLTSNEEIIDSNWSDIPGYSSTTGFSTENSEKLLERVISCSSNENDWVLDYFMGSGTTQSVAYKLKRKFIGIEMGKYFYTFPLVRLKQNLFGKKSGISNELLEIPKGGIIKYHDLESYEDVLNNLTLIQNKEQSSLLASSDFKDEYMLSYMLDVESRDSLLNVDAFKNPFNYKLNITRNNESQETVIDMVETFNYLIGLHVKTKQSIRGFKVITGVTNERDEETLVIWRNTEEKSNQDLNEFFNKMEFSTRDAEFQRIYVNGDNHLENLKTGEDKWKVALIEEEFMKRMFDVQDV